MKYLILIFSSFLLLNVTRVHAQDCFFSARENGRSVSIVKPFYTVSRVEDIHYKVHKGTKDFPVLSDKTFKRSHLHRPHVVVQSFLMADDNEWLKELSDDDHRGSLSEDIIQYKRTQEYQEKFELKVISEFYFTYESAEYAILLSYFYAPDKTYKLYPFLLIKKGNEWKISGNNKLQEFSRYMYLKPWIFNDLLTGNIVYLNNKKDFFEEYYFVGGIFNTTPNSSFGLNYRLEKKTSFSNLILAKDSLHIPDREIELKDTDFHAPIRITEKWSSSNGYFFNYSGFKKKVFSLEYDENRFGTPEEALVSWKFNATLDEKKKNSIGFDVQAEEIRNYHNQVFNSPETEKSSVEFMHKVIFEGPSDLYTLIFHKEWIDGKYQGKKSQLMKCINGEWKMVFPEDENLIKLIETFDQLNYEGLRLLFSGEFSNDEDVDWIFHDQILRWPDGKIYINAIDMPSEIPKAIRKE